MRRSPRFVTLSLFDFVNITLSLSLSVDPSQLNSIPARVVFVLVAPVVVVFLLTTGSQNFVARDFHFECLAIPCPN